MARKRGRGRKLLNSNSLPRAVRAPAALILASLLLATAVLHNCETPSRQTSEPAGTSSGTTASPARHETLQHQPPPTGAARREVRPEPVGLTPTMRAAASRPAAHATGLFLERPAAADFRVMTCNVGWDSIFPSRNTGRAEKFQRVLKAVDPDVLMLQEIRQFSADELAALLEAICPRSDGEPWYAFRGKSSAVTSKFPLSQTCAGLDPPTYRDPAIAIIDLPDQRCPIDLCVISNHFKCCGDFANDPIRQRQADGVMCWLRDARTSGGPAGVAPHTAFVIAGDLNLVGGLEPLLTLLTGDISDEAVFGADFAPDWDDTDLADAHPLHNGVGPDDYTWRRDASEYDPGRLDFVLYSDSALQPLNRFVLNTTIMSDTDLARCGLERLDCCDDDQGRDFDHLPVIVDFRIRTH